MSLEQEGKIVENYVDTAEYGAIWFSFRSPAGERNKAWHAHNRAHPLVSDWQFFGMGVASTDLDKAVEYYQNFNIADIESEILLDTRTKSELRVHGLSGMNIKLRKRTARIGSISYEFAQTLEQTTTLEDCIGKRSEGVYNLNFQVSNLKSEYSRLAYRGINVLFSGTEENGKPFAYFDTRKIGNLLIKSTEE